MKMKRRFVLDDYFEDNPMSLSGGDLLWWNQAGGFTAFLGVSKCEVRLTEMFLDFTDCGDAEPDPVRSPLKWVDWMRSIGDSE